MATTLTIPEQKLQLAKAFPPALKHDVEKVLQSIAFPAGGSFPNTFITVISKNEEIQFPYRVWFNEPTFFAESALTENQKTILDCISLRHHDGFVRQRRLEYLLGKTDTFIIPFVVQLLSEYVLKILKVIDTVITEDNIDDYIDFIRQNERYWQTTQRRLISYWNEHYRWPPHKNLTDYPGMQILKRLQNRRQERGMAH